MEPNDPKPGDPARRVSRTPLLLFGMILFLALSQIAWWVVVLIRDLDPRGGGRSERRARAAS